MTLSSWHRIRNSSPGGLRPSTLPLGHGGSPQYWILHVDGEETFLFASNRRDREPNPELWRESSGANHYPRAPAPLRKEKQGDWVGIWLITGLAKLLSMLSALNSFQLDTCAIYDFSHLNFSVKPMQNQPGLNPGRTHTRTGEAVSSSTEASRPLL